MKKYIVLFDLETTGLPKQPGYNKYYPPRKLSYYDSSRVVQIALTTYEIVEGLPPKMVFEEDCIIKPNGFVIQNAHIHNITHDIAIKTGINFKTAMCKFLPEFKRASLLVAHNAQFDIKVLMSELYRQGLTDMETEIKDTPSFCTSHGTTNMVKLKYNNKKFKQPKLIELYKWLFKKHPDDMDGQHNALWDTRVLSKCFIELLSKKYITLI
jgi:DNA polymerase-3 subunit alpha